MFETDHYGEIGVPVIAFSGLYTSNRTGTFRGFVNRINTTDFTGVNLANYGYYDVFIGTYSSRDVSQPVSEWMRNRLTDLRASAFTNVTVLAGWAWNFFAHGTGGTGLYVYQWYEGTTSLQGQTAMVLTVTKTAPGTYTYYCKITDSEGTTANTNNVTLTVMA